MSRTRQSDMSMAATLLLELDYKIMKTKTPNIYDVCFERSLYFYKYREKAIFWIYLLIY